MYSHYLLLKLEKYVLNRVKHTIFTEN